MNDNYYNCNYNCCVIGQDNQLKELLFFFARQDSGMKWQASLINSLTEFDDNARTQLFLPQAIGQLSVPLFDSHTYVRLMLFVERTVRLMDRMTNSFALFCPPQSCPLTQLYCKFQTLQIVLEVKALLQILITVYKPSPNSSFFFLIGYLTPRRVSRLYHQCLQPRRAQALFNLLLLHQTTLHSIKLKVLRLCS